MNFAQNDVSRPPRREGHETIKRLEITPGKVSAYTGTNPNLKPTQPSHYISIPLTSNSIWNPTLQTRVSPGATSEALATISYSATLFLHSAIGIHYSNV